MRTGVILELKSGNAVVLDASGGFRTLPAKPGWKPGDVVPLPRGRRTAPLAALAACLAVAVLGGTGGFLWFDQTGLVSLDVNPSVELGVNRFDRVVSVRALNDQGAELLEAAQVAGRPAGEAVETLLNGDYLAPYLDTEGYAALTVQADGAAQEEKLLNLAGASAARTDALVDVYAVDAETVSAAHGCGVTAGKYLALMELQAADPEADIMEYAHCGIGEIRRETERCHAQQLPPDSEDDDSGFVPGGCWNGAWEGADWDAEQGHHGMGHRWG